MTKTEIKTFRNLLEHRQNELGNGTRNREALAVETSPDEIDRIQNASERDYAMGEFARNSSRLRDVRDALHRLDAGTFGVCAECEETINPKRLAAIPWAAYCVVCQEAVDRGQTKSNDDLDAELMAA